MWLGRDYDCDIVICDANASRRHAWLEQNSVGAWTINDHKSTNGTALNNRLVSKAMLKSGDIITIGTNVLEFRDWGDNG
jgi:pSer/pThr/pTyr-binding forkhead associated (FHA) protein